MVKGSTLSGNESHENFMKRCFGDDFWERPVEERFDLVVRKCIAVRPEQMKKDAARKFRALKNDNK